MPNYWPRFCHISKHYKLMSYQNYFSNKKNPPASLEIIMPPLYQYRNHIGEEGVPSLLGY